MQEGGGQGEGSEKGTGGTLVVLLREFGGSCYCQSTESRADN